SSTANTDIRSNTATITAETKRMLTRVLMQASRSAALALAGRTWRPDRAVERRRRRRGGFGARCGRPLLGQLVERQIQHVVAVAGVDEHLRRARQHGLERLDVEPLTRDRRRAYVLGEDLLEVVRLALRFRDSLGAIRLGVLAPFLRLAARLGQ